MAEGPNDRERQVGLRLMSGKRQKIQYSLALGPADRGETPVSDHQGAEPLVAKPAPESPAWQA